LLIGTDNTARKQAEEALLKAGALQKAIFDSANFSSIATDAKGVIQIFNVGAERMLGYAAADVMNKITPADISDPQEIIARAQTLSIELDTPIAPGFEALVFKASRGIEDIYELTYIRKDGSRFPAVVSVTSLHDADNNIIGYLLIGTDNTARKQGEEKLKLAASVFTHAREGILIADADSNIIDVNEAFCRITGFERYEVLGQNPRKLLSSRNAEGFYEALSDDLVQQGYWYGEIWNQHKNGHDYAVIQAITAVRNDQGETKQYVSLFSDITRLKEHQIELEQMAHFDALTTLPNRVLLSDRLEQAIFQARRHAKTVAVVFLDLDGFKAVNDQHGHDVGDHLLVTLAQRMKHILREGDTLARIGGDEFVAVLLDLPSIESCEPMLMRLLSTIAQPIVLGKLFLQVSASLGVTFYPISEDVDADQLIRQADQAMYQAKLAGKNRFHVFDADLDRSLRGHHLSLERIRLALVQGEFELYYQPKVNMRTGEVIGVEALIRWNHPQKGLLSPSAFLPAIEDHPLEIEVGEWVINTALQQMARWQQEGLRMPVSVNVGARQLQQHDFVQRLEMILEGHPSVSPADLELEVLETSALQDLDRASSAIRACQAIGVTCVLDDFGTGYSSLTYLRRLPVNKLKLDQTFVMGMLDDPDDMSILEGVIGLAAAFKRPVIAEGVETLEHGLMLLLLGCELAQGHCISRPMPASKVTEWTETWVANWAIAPIWGHQPNLNRVDWPLLFVRYEQTHWLTKMMAFLNGEQPNGPSMDRLQSVLGKWLAGPGLSRYPDKSVYLNTQRLHDHFFEMAQESLVMHREGHPAEAMTKADALDDINSEIGQELKLFFKKIQTETVGQIA
jgi:diguanylate cyclase (GGDEF)-like protein/PAS domain S-box-containing protein